MEHDNFGQIDPLDVEDIHPRTLDELVRTAADFARGCQCQRCSVQFAKQVRMLLTPIENDRRHRREPT